MEVYNKILSRPEAKHRYWHIHKSEREFFPESGKFFNLEFDGKIFALKVNHKDDIMTGQLYERHKFQDVDRIIIKKKDEKTYVLFAPDTKLYSKL